jgi:hypothetical protein
VSPQFRKYPTSCRKKRQSRAKPNEQSTNTTLPRCELPKGFKPLKFFGDESTLLANTGNCENCADGFGDISPPKKNPHLDLQSDVDADLQNEHVKRNRLSTQSLEHLGEQNVSNSRQMVTRSRTKSAGNIGSDDKSDSPCLLETQKRKSRKVLNNPSKRLFAKVLNPEDNKANYDISNVMCVNSGAKDNMDENVDELPTKLPVRMSVSDSSPCRVFFPDGRPLWATPPVSLNAKVLVEDTPDAERGLSYKERLGRRLNPDRTEGVLKNIKE